jgi:CRP/FNR family transcriptional regulator
MVVLGQLTSTERVAHFLVEIDALYRERGVGGKVLSLLLSRAEIADYLGLRIETVSRAFGKLKKKGIIALVESDEVVIFDHSALRATGKA